MIDEKLTALLCIRFTLIIQEKIERDRNKKVGLFGNAQS